MDPELAGLDEPDLHLGQRPPDLPSPSTITARGWQEKPTPTPKTHQVNLNKNPFFNLINLKKYISIFKFNGFNFSYFSNCIRKTENFLRNFKNKKMGKRLKEGLLG